MADVPALEDLYDERTVVALDSWSRGAGRRRGIEPPVRRTRVGRGGVAAMAVSAIAVGLRDALAPDEATPIIELRPDRGGGQDRWVSYFHVPGAPSLSRIVVRPWLAVKAVAG